MIIAAPRLSRPEGYPKRGSPPYTILKPRNDYLSHAKVSISCIRRTSQTREQIGVVQFVEITVM